MLIRLFLTCALLLTAAGYLASAYQPETPLSAPLAALPLRLGDWHGRNDERFSEEIESVLGVDEYIVRTYTQQASLPVAMYVGFYKSQRQGDTMHSPMNCLPGAGWQPVAQSRATFPVPATDGSETPVTVNQFVIQKGLDRQLVLYWYQSHGRVVASEYASKLYLISDAITMNRTDAALVRVITPLTSEPGSEDAAIERSQQFVQTMYPALSRVLPS